jgi:hypothetical protein
MAFNIYEPDATKRVALGKLRESQIANALKNQHHLDIRDATDSQDKFRKIDRWLFMNGALVPLQIKFRNKGDDLLFEVYDTFRGWEFRDGITASTQYGLQNKIGRDMQGDALLYAVLLSDGKSVKIVDTAPAKRFIWEMVKTAETKGWTTETHTKTLRLTLPNGKRAELKLQSDPGDGRPKMVAYIPPTMFEGPLYTVDIPQQWAA